MLHKAFNQSNAALSSKIFMCCWDSSDEKSPVLLPTIDAPHPAKDASVFDTIDGLTSPVARGVEYDNFRGKLGLI